MIISSESIMTFFVSHSSTGSEKHHHMGRNDSVHTLGVQTLFASSGGVDDDALCSVYMKTTLRTKDERDGASVPVWRGLAADRGFYCSATWRRQSSWFPPGLWASGTDLRVVFVADNEYTWFDLLMLIYKTVSVWVREVSSPTKQRVMMRNVNKIID